MSFATVMLCLVSLLLSVDGVLSADSDDCVSKQELAEELATMKDETERRVDQLHSQLNYWQNVTVNILKDQCDSNTDDSVKTISKTVSNLTTLGYTPAHPACSCKEILQLAPQSLSGLYWISDKDNKPQHMYCDMELSCKESNPSGWMRLASINMTDNSNTCPPGLNTLTNPIRRCAMGSVTRPGCSSVMFPVQEVKYSRVCGKIIGYQDGSPDAFFPYIHNSQQTIDSAYVEGISLTHGQSPRKHIWTFAGALHEDDSWYDYVCPCTNTRNSNPPAVPNFVGNDYFCDTGSDNQFQHIFYPDDPLWDGAGCGQYNTCCTWNSPPWFRKDISPPTSDDIEMRLCVDQDLSDEDINFVEMELYVQ